MLEALLFLALIILGVVIWKTGLHNMILGMLDGHAEKVRAELDEAKKLREEATSLLAEHQRKLSGGEDQAGKIADHAEIETKRMVERHEAEFEGEPEAPRRPGDGAHRPGRSQGAARGQKPHGRSRDPHHRTSSVRQDGRHPRQAPPRRRDRGGQPETGLGGSAPKLDSEVVVRFGGHMIKLYQFPTAWGMNVSPFTLKVETWLKLSGLDYETIAVRNPGTAPKGKLPFIEDEDGTRIGDSSLIIDHLKRTRQIDPDHELTERQRAEAISLQRLFEDHLYFIGLYSRWIDPVGWETTCPAFFGFLPPGVRDLVGGLVRRQMRKSLHAQGLGRHSRDELYAMGRADLRAVAVQLGSRPYFFGDGPTTIDAIAYGFLANLLFVPVETELKQIGLEYDNLRLYCERLGKASV